MDYFEKVLSVAINHKFLSKLRWIGIVEGTSTLVLFGVAMPLKYFAGFPLAVRIAGSVHGFLFLGLVLMCCIAMRRIPLGFWWGLVGIVSAVVPFGPFIMDIHLKKLMSNS